MKSSQMNTLTTVLRRALTGWAIGLGVLGISGCDMLGDITPAQKEARKLADAKATGGACRHAARSIEECYINNPKANKASIFEGWREMDAYMRENNIAAMPAAPELPTKAASAEAPAEKGH